MASTVFRAGETNWLLYFPACCELKYYSTWYEFFNLKLRENVLGLPFEFSSAEMTEKKFEEGLPLGVMVMSIMEEIDLAENQVYNHAYKVVSYLSCPQLIPDQF